MTHHYTKFPQTYVNKYNIDEGFFGYLHLLLKYRKHEFAIFRRRNTEMPNNILF